MTNPTTNYDLNSTLNKFPIELELFIVMGPGNNNGSDLPSRPKFSWDFRNVPWTDGKGNQEQYAASVELWKAFHSKLPNSNANKIPSDLQGIMLQSQLYGRARELAKKVPDNIIQSDEGADAIVAAIHKRDALAVLSEVYKDFTGLLSTKRGQNESFKNFESRFEATASKFNAHSDDSALPESLLAFILMANSNIDNGQRISVLASATKNDSDLGDGPTTAEYLESVSYDTIASVIRQCDHTKSGDSDQNALRANSAKNGNGNGKGYGKNPRKRLSPQDFAEMKSKSQCHKCQRYGHWAKEHEEDGSLKPHVLSTESPPNSSSNSDGGASSDRSKKTVTFHMCNVTSNGNNEDFMNYEGPLLDDGAPYSGIGEHELNLIRHFVCPTWDGIYDAIPLNLQDRPYWQYGQGEHSSAAKKILGSIMLQARTDEGMPVYIRHLVITGSSQWIVGGNVTKKCDILHSSGKVLQLPNNGGTMSIVDNDLHSYLPSETFYESHAEPDVYNSAVFCATAQLPSEDVEQLPWEKVTKIIDKVHKHVCGHSTYSDMKVLLERNNIWNDDCQKYLGDIVECCHACRKTAEPKPPRKVSLSAMSREFNQVVCVDHLFLDGLKVFHAMDSVSRYSAGQVVTDTTMECAIASFETLWISPFWTPDVILGDPAFRTGAFKAFADKYDIQLRPLPPRRHNKNVLESKHRVIRDIFLRLQHANGNADGKEHVPNELLVQQAIRISNDLYGNDTMSANELAKGYTRPVLNGKLPVKVPKELFDAHVKLLAKRKLALVLRSKATVDENLQPGDLVEVFIKREHEKRGKWTAPRPVLSYDRTTNTVEVPGERGKSVRAAIEDIRPAIVDNAMAKQIQDSIDDIDLHIRDDIDNLCLESSTELRDESRLNTVTDNDDLGFGSLEPEMPSVGERIDVYWPLDDKHYTGTVSDVDESGLHHIDYDDGDVEVLNLVDEQWRVSDSTAPVDLQASAVTSSRVELNPGKELTSVAHEAIEQYYNQFGTSEFFLHQAQGLPEFVTQNAYEKEEAAFMANVERVHVSKIPKGANVITSHTQYKVKYLDDGNKLLKARIAPHGNKDDEKDNMKTDSATCPPIGFRILISLAVIYQWFITKVDFESAFLQTGRATRDVYVVPPKECTSRTFYWLLLAAAYGLVNSNAKWQQMSDNLLFELGFLQLAYVPQLFYRRESGSLQAVAVKIVDDILLCGEELVIANVVTDMKTKYKIGTIVSGPGNLKFNGLDLYQDNDCRIQVNCDERLKSLEPYPIDRTRRRQIDEHLNSLELASFRSLNGSLGWMGVTASPLCALASSHLQQLTPTASVRNMITQINLLRLLKKLGTTITYKRPEQKGEILLSILTFADASRRNENGQLGFITGLLFGPMTAGSTFHPLSWSSQKSKRPVKSIGAAETLAAGSAIDDGKVLAKSYQTLLGVDVDLTVAVDSNDLWETISTCRASIDKSIRADVSVIRYEFETHHVNNMVWIPGNVNLADPLTKTDSPLTKALQLTLYGGELCIDSNEFKTRSSNQSTG